MCSRFPRKTYLIILKWLFWHSDNNIRQNFLPGQKKGHEVQIFNSTWVPGRHMGLGKAGTATDWHCHTDHQETISGSATKALFNHSDRAVTFLELQRHLSNWHKSNIQDQNVSLRNFWGLITHDILICQPKLFFKCVRFYYCCYRTRTTDAICGPNRPRQCAIKTWEMNLDVCPKISL